ncbi:hypothetical protein [Allomesorhizobium camelthorni]|uniref:hypothetical protein n=1 Tax=Allomesorhizobium camelthorni TaxID=475069 RepID=UPI001FE8151E|nr:hypothetical protein [Mesorhizobium camelthorni]
MTVVIQTLIGEYEIEWGLLAAGTVVGALPTTVRWHRFNNQGSLDHRFSPFYFR